MQVTLIQRKEKRKMIVTFRLFNDGLGFRYEFPVQDNLKYFTVIDENTQFALTGDHKTFWIPGDYDSQEYTYTTSLLSEINSSRGKNVDEISVKSIPGENFVQTPLMMKTKDGLYINIHEAALSHILAGTLARSSMGSVPGECEDRFDCENGGQEPQTTHFA